MGLQYWEIARSNGNEEFKLWTMLWMFIEFMQKKMAKWSKITINN